MATHVRTLAWINIVLGGLGVLLALIALAGSAVLSSIMQAFAGDLSVPIWFIQAAVTLVFGIILTLSLPCLIVGWGLYNFRRWARMLGLVLCAISLFNVPLGTAMAVYGFWVLLKPESEVLFQ